MMIKGCRGEGGEWFHSAFHVLLQASYLFVLERRNLFRIFFETADRYTTVPLLEPENILGKKCIFVNRKKISFGQPQKNHQHRKKILSR